MKITEDAREAIQAALEEQGSTLWIRLVSEVHGFGQEGIFWFLIDEPGVIPAIYTLFCDVIKQPLAQYDETEFTVSFRAKQDGKMLIYDVIEDDELRSGRLRWSFGGEPDVRPLREEDVFGRNSN